MKLFAIAAFTLSVVLIAAVAYLSQDVEPIEDLVSYDMSYGKPQPPPNLPPHFDREFDPWARDGVVKRGSFLVERKVEHGLKNQFWLVITGIPGNEIRCSIRGFSEYLGHPQYDGWRHSYESESAIVTDLLPCIRRKEYDTVTCNDLTTGERQYFRLEEWHPEHEKKVEPWETDAAAKWMKAHGLSDFRPESAPLYGTSAESKENYDMDDSNNLSPGEQFMFRTGHPPIYTPPYEEEMGGHLSAAEAKEQIPYKGEYQRVKDDDLSVLRRNRSWRTMWQAWQAGLKHDKENNVPRSEWRQHWN